MKIFFVGSLMTGVFAGLWYTFGFLASLSEDPVATVGILIVLSALVAVYPMILYGMYQDLKNE